MKHKIALFFTVFPKEADGYIAEIEEYEREEEERENQNYDQIAARPIARWILPIPGGPRKMTLSCRCIKAKVSWRIKIASIRQLKN